MDFETEVLARLAEIEKRLDPSTLARAVEEVAQAMKRK